jgi:tetratricopeptide (TPR) repeat protein
MNPYKLNDKHSASGHGIDSPHDWIEKAKKAVHEGDYNKAIQYYDKYLIYNPSNEETWLEKGRTLYSMGQYDQAIKIYEKVLKQTNQEPISAEAFNDIGNALLAKGKFREALKCYDKEI